MKLTIIIPAYNEEKRIGETLIKYATFFDQMMPHDYRILVIPNNCSDNTVGVVKDVSAKYPTIKYHAIEGHVGKGGAIIKGLQLASSDIVAYTDADGATPPYELHNLILENEDCVIGSRWLNKKGKRQPVTRIILSRGLRMVLWVALGFTYHDVQCGAKVLNKKSVDYLKDKLVTSGFAFDIELINLLRKGDFSVKEVPINWYDKSGSKVKPSAPLEFMKAIYIIKTRSYVHN